MSTFCVNQRREHSRYRSSLGEIGSPSEMDSDLRKTRYCTLGIARLNGRVGSESDMWPTSTSSNFQPAAVRLDAVFDKNTWGSNPLEHENAPRRTRNSRQCISRAHGCWKVACMNWAFMAYLWSYIHNSLGCLKLPLFFSSPCLQLNTFVSCYSYLENDLVTVESMNTVSKRASFNSVIFTWLHVYDGLGKYPSPTVHHWPRLWQQPAVGESGGPSPLGP